MATITTINGSDTITSSRAVINTNFSNVNSGLPTSMTVSAFNTETTSGTLNPNGRTTVCLSDSIYAVIWSGSSWEYYTQGMRCYPMSSTEAATWVNQGTATFTTSAPVLYLEGPNGGNGVNLRGLVRSLPATPFTVIAAVRLLAFGGNTNNTKGGLILRESGTGKLVSFGIGAAGAVTTDAYASATSTSSIASQVSSMLNGAIEWLKIADNGTNRVLSFSHDGIQWMQFDSRTRSSNFTTAPDQIGIFIDPWNGYGNCGIQIISWKIS